jgi:aspartyl-tRNA(Asn)/glutamyl-tRNA(Gln) amidotransferase subunit C
VSVSVEELRRVASLARIAVDDDAAAALTAELSSILAHMEVLATVDTDGVQEAIGVGARGLPVRGDHGPPIALARSVDAFAPSVRDGFILVPRLASHESTPEQ